MTVARVPVAGWPVLDAPAEAREIDRAARQRRGRELLNRGGELVAPSVSFSYQSAACSPLSRWSVRLSGRRPHIARPDQRSVDALGKILLGRNAEAIRNDVDVSRGVARLDPGHRLLGREPVADIVDGAAPRSARRGRIR